VWWIFKFDFIANLLTSLSVKEFYEKRLAFREVTDKSVGIRFLDHPLFAVNDSVNHSSTYTDCLVCDIEGF